MFPSPALLLCVTACIGLTLPTPAAHPTDTTPTLRLLAQFEFKHPAFATTIRTAANRTDLLLSSFGVSFPGRPSPDGVSVVADIASALQGKSFRARALGNGIVWPNEVSEVTDVQTDERMVVAPGGFLVPGKHGHVSVMAVRDLEQGGSPWTPIVRDQSGFYHRVVRVPIYGKSKTSATTTKNNADGQKTDSGDRWVTCRGEKGLVGAGKGAMYFLEPTESSSSAAASSSSSSIFGSNEPTGLNGYDLKWMAAGCDIFFAVTDLNRDGVPEFIIAEFFAQRLVLQWTDHPDGDYSKPEFIRQRVIDDQTGALFDVQMADLDGDGVDEILVSNHQSGKKGIPPSVFAYYVELPTSMKHQSPSQQQTVFGEGSLTTVAEFMAGLSFRRQAISQQFEIINRSFMAAGPGGAQAVLPFVGGQQETTKNVPVLIVSGDGTEKAYLLVRQPSGSYSQTVFHDCKGTVGGIHVLDVDGDGWQEVFVPCYDTNYVAIFTFKP